MNVSRVVRVYGAVCDPGPTRQLNEDAYIAAPERQLFGVADGFGGNGIGDAAAKKCLEDVKYFVENGLGDSEVTLPFVYRRYLTESANLIFNAFLFANEQLVLENRKRHLNARGGASALFAFFQGRHLTLANVGLCGATLIRRGRAQPLVKPRSYNSVKGVFPGTWNSKWGFPLLALGQSVDLEPEIIEFIVEKGDILILSSDGIYPYLTDADFSEVYQIFTSKKALDEAIHAQHQRLVSLSQHKGSTDNLSMISIVCG